MRRRVLCGCWARLAFLRAREKKALVVVVAKIEAGLSIELLPACPWLTAGRRGMMNTPDRARRWSRSGGGLKQHLVISAGGRRWPTEAQRRRL